MSLPLKDYLVLDLAQGGGMLCGKMLSDLGAEVIKVEKPGGDPARGVGPFYHGEITREKSLYWWAYNAGKKSITLDVGAMDGRSLFRKLAAKADIIIESFPPGFLDEIRLGYTELASINPRIIMTSITPFGQTGPCRDWPASDLTVSAMGGLMYIVGDTDRAPVRISFPQAELTASTEAAVGTLIALYSLEISGEGQQVDVSSYQSQVMVPLNSIPFWELARKNIRRDGIFRGSLGEASRIRYLWPCKDGYIILLVYGGTTGAKSNKALVEWMVSEGMADDYIKSINWDDFAQLGAFQDRQNTVETYIEKFLMTHTKKELYEGALKRGIMLGPVFSIGEAAENPQLQARGFWVEIEHPELGTTVTYPGPFAKASEALCQVQGRPPQVGEHNHEVYSSRLGMSQEELEILIQQGVI